MMLALQSFSGHKLDDRNLVAPRWGSNITSATTAMITSYWESANIKVVLKTSRVRDVVAGKKVRRVVVSAFLLGLDDVLKPVCLPSAFQLCIAWSPSFVYLLFIFFLEKAARASGHPRPSSHRLKAFTGRRLQPIDLAAPMASPSAFFLHFRPRGFLTQLTRRFATLWTSRNSPVGQQEVDCSTITRARSGG
jgi:hypothetical protein